jgi:type IV pilus assembly protein PilN
MAKSSNKQQPAQEYLSLVDINLLPDNFKSVRRDYSWITDRRAIYPTVMAFVLLLAIGGFHSNMVNKLSGMKSNLESIKASIERERPLLLKIKELDEKLKIIAQKNKALKSIQVSKKRWVIIFESISSVLPENTWLTEIEQDKNDFLEITGKTYDFSEVAAYMEDLEGQVSFPVVELGSIGSVRERNSDKDVYKFVLKCAINKDLGLE